MERAIVVAAAFARSIALLVLALAMLSPIAVRAQVTSPAPHALILTLTAHSTIGPSSGADQLESLSVGRGKLQLFGGLADGSRFFLTSSSGFADTRQVVAGTAATPPATNADVLVQIVETDKTHYRWISEMGPDRDGVFVVKTTEDCTRNIATR